MKIGSLLLPALAIAALLIAAIACDTGESSLSASDLAALTQYNQGIRVTGTGTVSVAPDVAMLSMGVEATAETADEARREAATAMNAVMDVLRTRGIDDSDVQTTQFSIVPEYRDSEPHYMEGESLVGAIMGALESMSSEDSGEKDLEDGEAFGGFMEMLLAMGMMTGEEGGQFPEILADGYPDGLAPIGYRVTNNAVVKVRDLAAVGAVIDEIVQAGDDAARVDGVWFNADDTTEARRQAREMAMNDALARADELAAHAGTTRGKLLNVSEDSSGGIYYDEYAFLEAPFTPISGWELEVQVSVHATFAVE